MRTPVFYRLRTTTFPGMPKARTEVPCGLSHVEKLVQNQIRLRQGGGTRGGSRPPRMGSNAPEALPCKDSGERSKDFCAEQRRKSNGIFAGCRKSPLDFFDSLEPARKFRAGLLF